MSHTRSMYSCAHHSPAGNGIIIIPGTNIINCGAIKVTLPPTSSSYFPHPCRFRVNIIIIGVLTNWVIYGPRIYCSSSGSRPVNRLPNNDHLPVLSHIWPQIKIECLHVSRHIPMLNRRKITGDAMWLSWWKHCPRTVLLCSWRYQPIGLHTTELFCFWWW